ncbi:MAG: TonB-dependent receptor [Burkholderiales bacterium]|nr:TonB-dependent receptor [Burkholderiales bacterium]
MTLFRLNPLPAAARLAVGAGAVAGTLGTLGTMSAPALAQEQRIEITGSAIRRLDAETALPVQILRREDIARTGVSTVEQLLQSIAAVSSQGAITNAVGAGNSTYGLSSVSLRGLGEDRTLVLVNGRRLAAFAGGNGASVNVNAIPLAAVERVEVLKDGASSLYGSDAIAGVVNFILSKDFQGVEIAGTYNQPTRSGGGDSQRVSLVAGFGDRARDRFNATVSLSLHKEAALFAKDRDFARTGNVPPYIAAAATGQGNIEGAYNPGTGAPYDPAAENVVGNTPGRQPGFGNSPGTGYGNPLAATNQCGLINMYLDPSLTTNGNPFCTFDSNAFVGLVPKTESTALTGNFAFAFSDSLEAFADVLYSRNIATQRFQPSPLRRSFMVTDALFAQQGVEPALIIRPTNPNYALAAAYLTAQGFGALVGQPLAVTARVFDFGDRTQEDTSTQTRMSLGLRGSLAGQEWEVAATQNRNKLSGTVPDGYFSQVAFARVVNSPTSDYNPWSLTQSAAFNAALAASGAKYTGSTLDAKSESTSVDGRVTGDIVKLPAGALQYAAGLQARQESLVTTPSAALGTGDIAGLGGATPPVDRERKIGSAFGELNIPVIKGLEGTVAARYDRYNDVGSSSTYKGSVRFQPMREVLLRGSVGTGFRAPTLIDLWQPQALGSSEQFNDDGPGGTGQTDLQVNSLTGGNPALKPEKSTQSSVGLVLQPLRELSIGIDYFQFKVEDIISLPSAQEVVSRFRAGDPAFAGLVTLTPGTNDIESIIQTLQNVGSAKARGVDLDVSYRMNLGGSRLDLGLSGTYFIQFDQTSPGGAVSRKVGTIVEGPNGDPVLSTNSGVLDGVVLRWKHYLSATWSTGAWALTFAQNYYHGYRDGNDLNGNEHRVPAQSIYDAQVAFTGIKNVKVALGARNLFDKDPPLFIPTSNQFQAGYDITQYDPRGRVVYLSGSFRF